MQSRQPGLLPTAASPHPALALSPVAQPPFGTHTLLNPGLVNRDMFNAVASLGIVNALCISTFSSPLPVRKSLMRFAVALMPAGAYLGSGIVHSLIQHIADRTDHPPPFVMTSTTERARQQRLNLQDHRNLASAYLVAWLGHTHSERFSCSEIAAAVRDTSHPSTLVRLATGARLAGWGQPANPGRQAGPASLAIPGGRRFHTRATGITSAAGAGRFAFFARVTTDCRPEAFSLPLHHLQVSHVLIVALEMVPGQPFTRIMGIERRAEDSFRLFDSQTGLHALSHAALMDNLGWLRTRLPHRTNVSLLQLCRESAPGRETPV